MLRFLSICCMYYNIYISVINSIYNKNKNYYMVYTRRQVGITNELATLHGSI